MRLNEILSETSEKIAVFSFGRMNPPTRGHEKLILAGKKLADSKNADFFVFPSKSHGGRKNPLDIKTKLKYLRGFFPEINFVSDAVITSAEKKLKPVRTPFEVLRWLEQQGYNRIYMVVGDDRVNEFKRIMGEYIPTINPSANPETAYDFDLFDVVSAGERDPDSSGVAGASGTKAREYAISGEEEMFVNQIAPISGDDRLKKALYNDVRLALGIKK